MKEKAWGDEEYLEVVTSVAVIAAIFWGVKEKYGIGKTAFMAIAVGVGTNYIITNYYKYINNG